jgi:plasmid stabilization system protein ParE
LKSKWAAPALADLHHAVTYIAKDNPTAANIVALQIWVRYDD